MNEEKRTGKREKNITEEQTIQTELRRKEKRQSQEMRREEKRTNKTTQKINYEGFALFVKLQKVLIKGEGS